MGSAPTLGGAGGEAGVDSPAGRDAAGEGTAGAAVDSVLTGGVEGLLEVMGEEAGVTGAGLEAMATPSAALALRRGRVRRGVELAMGGMRGISVQRRGQGPGGTERA